MYIFELQEAERYEQPVPVSINFSGINLSDLALFNGEDQLPYQLDATSDHIWFLHYPEHSATYTFKKVTTSLPENTKVKAEKKDGNLHLSVNQKSLLQYRYQITFPPEGVDSIFKKSGFIHPIMTLAGDTLTRIQPPDHWHHYGLWGPWTHTQVNGERVDFWNLGEGMGTVLFKEFSEASSGNIYAAFTARQEHIDLKTKAAPQVALNEDLKVTLWNLDLPDRYMVDYTSGFSSPLENGILFEAYRYGGGIGLRFHERWKADNSSVLTSEGKDRLTADGSNARWCIISGAAFNGGSSGILFMSHPENRMHPEPMRVWPIDGNNGRGDMFFEFCPIRNEEWQIEPDKKYELKYRMVVFDGDMKAEEAEGYWQAFAGLPVAISINN